MPLMFLGSLGARNSSNAAEREDTQDQSLSFSYPNTAWEKPWGSLPQSQSTDFGRDDHNDYEDRYRYEIRLPKSDFRPND